jgi:hypothetical protein
MSFASDLFDSSSSKSSTSSDAVDVVAVELARMLQNFLRP